MHEHNPRADELPRNTRKLAVYMSWTAAVILALVPFHAFLTVWASTVVGQYTALRLWKEFLLALLLAAALYMVIASPKFGRYVFRQPVVIAISLYGLLLALSGAYAHAQGTVSGLAYAYGFLQHSRFLVFFLVVWVCVLQTDMLARYWKQLLLIPGAIVSAVAVLQYLALPPDVLKYFGYGPGTIPAVSTIDDKEAYQRVVSTLRGPNPLGAYLVVILTALAALIARARRIPFTYSALLLLGSLALVFSFSRSAWIGLIISFGLLAWIVFRKHLTVRRLLLVAVVAAVAFSATLYLLRDNDTFQNAFFHTDESSQSSVSSNAGRLGAMLSGIEDVIEEPFGRGTGTAGPASIYNADKEIRLAENYYLQVAQEIGVIGLGLFIAINVLVAISLWRRRSNVLAQILLSSLAGIAIINLLSHAWTDDTLAYVWWGLAGIAVAGRKTAENTNSDDIAV